MSCTGGASCRCGCCAGVVVETPAAIDNRPGLGEIAYRVGTHARFMETMVSRLSGGELVRAGLRTRQADDFAVALCDGCASIADVLTFHHERLANESFFRTATERESIVELSRLIGYGLRPGVAASTYLAITVEEPAPGTDAAGKGTTIAAGLRVQSVPAQGQTPQTFETVETIVARPEWNAMRPRQTEQPVIDLTASTIWCEGLATGLKAGDGIILMKDKESLFRQVIKVTVQASRSRTQVDLAPTGTKPRAVDPPPAAVAKGLAAVSNSFKQSSSFSAANLNATASIKNVQMVSIFANLTAVRDVPPAVLAVKTRAAIFGHNAPAFKTLPASLRVGEIVPKDATTMIFKAGAYSTHEATWADKVTLDAYPGGGAKSIYLDTTYPGIVKGSWIALKSPTKTMVYQVNGVADESWADFTLSAKVTRLDVDVATALDNFWITDTTVFAQSEELTLARKPVDTPVAGLTIELDRWIDGLFVGQHIIVSGELDDMRGVRTAEHAVIAQVVHDLKSADGVTTITLNRAIAAYVRDTVTIYGNVAHATHGESVSEVLGDGDAARPLQRFTLKQPPLTYLQSASVSGVESTLRVRVNDILWHEVPALYGHADHERVFTTDTSESGTTTVMFGGGAARLPTGRQNVRASYRKGTGIYGLLDAGQLNMLLTRPLGVRAVVNPIATAGAAPPESLLDARRNAPLTVLTLDRIVSLQDHEDFARAFAGVAKALASWTWDCRSRTVLVTVAGANGAAIAPDSDLRANLLEAMQKAGGPFVRRRVESYRRALFRVGARIVVDSDYSSDLVLANVEAALRRAFDFDAREFGQPVLRSEVLSIMHRVAGVVAVDLDSLSRTDHLDTVPAERLPAALPQSGDDGEVQAAELLTLDAAPLELVVMP